MSNGDNAPTIFGIPTAFLAVCTLGFDPPENFGSRVETDHSNRPTTLCQVSDDDAARDRFVIRGFAFAIFVEHFFQHHELYGGFGILGGIHRLAPIYGQGWGGVWRYFQKNRLLAKTAGGILRASRLRGQRVRSGGKPNSSHASQGIDHYTGEASQNLA